MRVAVLKPGLQTTIQSRPRIGLRHLGVPSSGAADPLSLALANKLVGNAWDSAALEVTLLGPTLQFETDTVIGIGHMNRHHDLDRRVLVDTEEIRVHHLVLVGMTLQVA